MQVQARGYRNRKSRSVILVSAFCAGIWVMPAAGASYPRAGWIARLSTIFHDVDGVVTIVDEATLRVDHFTYVGPAPAVYFYLGETNSSSAFANGLGLEPQLTRDYADESLILTLPPGETLDTYTAISVWCAAVSVNFGSGTFTLPCDSDDDGDVDVEDYVAYADCAAGPDTSPSPTGMSVGQCLDIFDVDEDADVDLSDFARLQDVWTVPPFTAEYELVFAATWSAATHPDDFPPNPHFSGLIGGTHNEAVSFWEVGGAASNGMESMAETGGKTALTAEVQAAITAGSAGQLISGPGISVSPGSASVVFTATQDHPLASVVTMIAPSPDWFVGVSAYPLLQNGQWIDEVIIPLQPYDSGTDSGVTYTSANADVTPHEPITEIIGWPLEFNGTVAPLGTFTFRRLP